MHILFFGSAQFALPSLRLLHQSSHQIVGVVTQPDKPAGRGQKVTASPVAVVAKELKLSLFQPDHLKTEKIVQELLSTKPDLLVVVAYGQFLPEVLIRKTPKGAINLHPSLLPKYRGAAPIQWAILNGDTMTGVTTMKVANQMDAGDIYLQKEMPIATKDTSESLHEKLSELGAQLVLETVSGLEKGALKTTPQDSSKVVLAPKLTKEMGRLDFSRPAVELERKIRALKPWPHAYFLWEGKQLIVHHAEVVSTGTTKHWNEWVIPCGQEALRLLEVQLEGKQRMNAKEFLKGHPVL